MLVVVVDGQVVLVQQHLVVVLRGPVQVQALSTEAGAFMGPAVAAVAVKKVALD